MVKVQGAQHALLGMPPSPELGGLLLWPWRLELGLFGLSLHQASGIPCRLPNDQADCNRSMDAFLRPFGPLEHRHFAVHLQELQLCQSHDPCGPLATDSWPPSS